MNVDGIVFWRTWHFWIILAVLILEALVIVLLSRSSRYHTKRIEDVTKLLEGLMGTDREWRQFSASFERAYNAMDERVSNLAGAVEEHDADIETLKTMHGKEFYDLRYPEDAEEPAGFEKIPSTKSEKRKKK